MQKINELLLTHLNLTEVVIRDDDTIDTLMAKVRIATILGTFQSTLTEFPYLRKIWKKNTEEERLLGVSLTGIMDNELMNGTLGPEELIGALERMKQYAVDVNNAFANDIGVPPSAAITCVKPSGTVSQLVDSASGIHARHSAYYIRSVRGDNKDPLTQFMKEIGIPSEPELNKPDQTTVFYFPMKSPETSVFRNDQTAIEQLELWKIYQLHWCEHKPSVTISVREEEWPEVGGWVYKNFDYISGVSFLPYSDHTYRQAPYQECTDREYVDMLEKMPERVDWNELGFFEQEDSTVGMSTLACSSDGCEIVDLT